jgi:hypothetical protein
MNWPQFLNPLTAAVAAAVAIPLLLLLYFLKLRREEKVISSTLLWKKAIQDLQVNAPFQRLRKNLLLLLQLLVLLLLCLALARPMISYIGSAGKTTVILIDRSASMSTRDANQGRTRLEEARRLASEIVDSMARDANAMVIAVDDAAQTVQLFTSDRVALKRAIESIQPTDRRSRLKLAFQLADAQMAFLPEQNRPNREPPDVMLFSDGRVADADELSLKGLLKYIRIGQNDTPNIGVVSLSARRNYERPTEVQVFARLANYGPAPARADVRLSIDGKPSRVGSVNLAPERWNDHRWLQKNPGRKQEGFAAQDSVEFTVDLADAALLSVEQLNKDDALAADDTASVVVPPAKSLKVVLVSDGNYFLEKALQTLPLKEPGTLDPAVYEAKPPEDADVIIFDRWMPKVMPQAGTFIYFGSVPPNSKLSAETRDGAIVTVSNPQILDWRRDHPVLRYLSLSKRAIAESLKLNVPLDAQVLIDGSEGPLMVLYREPQRTHLVVAFDLLQSDWPTRPSFPVFLNSAMQFLALTSQSNARESVAPGTAPTLERAAIMQADPKLTPVSLLGPINATVPVPPTGDLSLPALDRVGIYQTQPPIPPFEKIAVNLLDENESNTLPVDVPPGHIGTMLAVGASDSRLDLWWWLIACGAVPLLMIEWWVYTRRVHL